MPDSVAPPRSAADALNLCRRHASSGNYVVSEAAHERLRVGGVSQSDVVNALATATSCSAASDGRWTIHGQSLDGQPLSILVAYVDGGLTVL
jgi:hypothetical protein